MSTPSHHYVPVLSAQSGGLRSQFTSGPMQGQMGGAMQNQNHQMSVQMSNQMSNLMSQMTDVLSNPINAAMSGGNQMMPQLSQQYMNGPNQMSQHQNPAVLQMQQGAVGLQHHAMQQPQQPVMQPTSNVPPTPPTQPQAPASKEFNTASLCRIGQETVQDIVSRTQEVFQTLRTIQPPNGTPQGLNASNEKKAKIQEQLRTIRLLFKRLRLIYEKCNENCQQGMEYTHIESLIPFKDEIDPKYDEKKNSEAYRLVCEESKEVMEQVVLKNKQLKESLIDHQMPPPPPVHQLVFKVHSRYREVRPDLVPKCMTENQPYNIRIPLESMEKIPELKENPFRKRICEIFSRDGKGDLSFEDFLDLLSVFSEQAPRDIKVYYAFRLYDFDGDRHIGLDDLDQALRLLTRHELMPEDMKQIIEKVIEEADVDGDGKLSYMEFEHVITRAPDFFSNFHIRM